MTVVNARPYPTKPAADLECGDMVRIAEGDWRRVAVVAFTDEPVDSAGTTGVRIWWEGHEKSSVVAADKEMVLAQPFIPR